MPAVIRSLDIEAPPSKVWHWLASQEALRRWLRPNLEIDLRVGGGYRMLGSDEETWISGVVLELVPERALVLSWMEEDAGWAHPARLVIELVAIAEGTRVSLTHDGFAGIGKDGWPGTLEAYDRGADRHRILEQLAELVANDGG
jgi:uncharacterized protein YndB with AHSA1/START domain